MIIMYTFYSIGSNGMIIMYTFYSLGSNGTIIMYTFYSLGSNGIIIMFNFYSLESNGMIIMYTFYSLGSNGMIIMHTFYSTGCMKEGCCGPPEALLEYLKTVNDSAMNTAVKTHNSSLLRPAEGLLQRPHLVVHEVQHQNQVEAFQDFDGGEEVIPSDLGCAVS